MTNFKNSLMCLLLTLGGAFSASAFTTNDADTIFNAYHTAFFVTNGGNSYYKMNTGPGTSVAWWTFAEEIEMAEDAYDNAPSPARRNIVSSICNGFISAHGSNWTLNNGNYNEYNDDIAWAVIAFSRAYLITSNTTYRDIAKVNFDAMFSRAWETNFTGGGLWWRQSDKQSKNACINGPAAIAACYLYHIYGDSSYLSKAKDCYAWNRRVLFNPASGAISDNINTNYVIGTWASTYNQGTFIGGANFLYRVTGLPNYYQDAILAGKYTQNSISSAGILPEYGSGDLGGFTGIFARWMARFAKEQNLWAAFGPWLTTNANAAWSVRNTNNLAWQKWKTATPAGTNILDSWDCSPAVVIMQVANPSPADALQITPSAGFTAVAQFTKPPVATGVNFVLTNTSAAALNWSLANTSAWLNVSVSSGTLAAAGSTTVMVSVIPAATTNLSAGRYHACIGITNLASGLIASRWFTLAIASGNAPIALTGYNAALLAPSTATSGTPGATAFDIPNSYCLYQAGLNAATRGLPPDGVFTSQLDATTVFQFKPYGTTNALVLGSPYPSSATLTLATPQAYNSLSILAVSTHGGGLGTFVLNFTNGTQSQVFSFNAPDWFSGTNNAAITGIGRLKLGASMSAEDNGASNPNLYQTTINLAALGLNQTIRSITFTKPAAAGTCGIFAVSGLQAYREPVITQQPTPTNLFRFTGATNSWSVAANAGLPVYYSWCLNGVPIPTATNTTYAIPSLLTNHSGNYTVVISNAFGSVTSSVAVLTVLPAPTYPYGQLVAAAGAVGYWRLDETSGTVARDYLANNNGTYTAKVLLGQPGNKLLDTHPVARFGFLASSNSCVTNIPVDFATAGNAAFSVEAWVNGGAQTTDAGLVTKGYGGGGEQFNLDCGSGGSRAFRFFVRDASGSARLANSSVVPNNQWHHLVGVCDQANGVVYLYVDGTNAAQGTITPNVGLLSSTTPMSIGSRQSGAGTAYNNQFVGYLEEVAVYNYALSSNQVAAHYQAVTNRPPAFLVNPFALASLTAGQTCAGTVATNASDPNGDALTFAKASGPAWLTVASNGSLSGVPLSSNVGDNNFTVRATDPSGLFSPATMTLTVLAAPPIVGSAALQGTNLLLNWGGGVAPYQVQFTTNLLNPDWQNWGTPVNVTSLLVPLTNGTAFYRIYGQ